MSKKQYMNYVMVSFNGSPSYKLYKYKNHDMSVGYGDTLVVSSPSGFATVVVKSVTNEGNGATKWIVCKVDTSEWNFLTQCDINKEKKLGELRIKYAERRNTVVDSDKKLKDILKEVQKLETNYGRY